MHERDDAGFTLTELMIVLVIVGIMSAVAVPLLGRDRQAREGRDFVSDLARDLQRAKVQAVTDRLPIRAFVYQDRVELRSAVPGAAPGAAPRTATVADPPLLRLAVPIGINIVAVQPTGAATPASQQLNKIVPALIDFNSLGQARLDGGVPLSSTTIFIRNDAVPASHPDRAFRIEIAGLTGFVRVRQKWP